MTDEPILAEVEGEAMLIDMERGVSYFLNETGVLIYKMLKEGEGEEEIKARLLKEYEASEEDVEQDIREFQDVLKQKAIPWAKSHTSSRR